MATGASYKKAALWGAGIGVAYMVIGRGIMSPSTLADPLSLFITSVFSAGGGAVLGVLFAAGRSKFKR